MIQAYEPDRSLTGKLRRRVVRLQHRRPVAPRGLRPAVSFAFDDPPVSATRAGAEVLAKHDLRGTYFVSSGLLGADGPMGPFADWSDVQRLGAAGHEVACHTYSHLDCGKSRGAAVLEDVEQNQLAFRRHDLPMPRTFAYPYGDVSKDAKAALSSRFGLMRALHKGLIEDGADLSQAPAVGIEGEAGEATAREWLFRAAERSAWLILYTHDVSDEPSQWGCTPLVLERLTKTAIGLGMDIITVEQGLDRLRQA